MSGVDSPWHNFLVLATLQSVNDDIHNLLSLTPSNPPRVLELASPPYQASRKRTRRVTDLLP